MAKLETDIGDNHSVKQTQSAFDRPVNIATGKATIERVDVAITLSHWFVGLLKHHRQCPGSVDQLLGEVHGAHSNDWFAPSFGFYGRGVRVLYDGSELV
jgi:hypothetical protein